MSHLTSETKAKLSSTIRELRDRLLADIHDTADSTYRLSLPIEKAGLAEEQRVKRCRYEQWLQEQDKDLEIARLEAEKLAAATFLNRLVVIKQLEALELIKPKVVTGGWQSRGYQDFQEFARDLCKDDSEGFSTLLGLLYDEWALDLPGLFGKVGITELLPVPSVTLRATIEALNNPELDSAWLDDTTLGWVYQFWNDPDRKALDEKINNRGKIEHHEIAAKTQIFTERYMVEWLLQNSLNQQWLAICAKNNWIPQVKANGVLDALEERRKQWRKKREEGEVSAEEMMPINGSQEEQWKYWVSQPLLPETIEAAPQSIKDLKLIDPAVGSGHFLVIAFSLLFSFYKEEAEHRGETWKDTEIAESIIENNLHGVDLDSRAVQIAAAALFLKAKSYCPDAHPRWMNLVASNLGLSSLPIESPEVNELQLAIYQATGIPADLIAKIIQALHGADHLGSLLKIDEAIETAIAEYEQQIIKTEPVQGDLFTGYPPTQMMLSFDETKKSILTQLGKFLAKCTSGDDLGLRLRGEQLAAGVRFIEIVKENKYHLCVANPPYLGTSSLSDANYIDRNYGNSKADLYAAFLERGLQLTCPYGLSAMITMRGWMFIKNYAGIRQYLLKNKDLRAIGDLEVGAFEEILGEVVTTAMTIFSNNKPTDEVSIGIKTSDLNLKGIDNRSPIGKQTSLLLCEPKYNFIPSHLEVIEGQPIIYWWDDDFLKRYAETPKLEEESDVKVGMQTSNNIRFTRFHWEVVNSNILVKKVNEISDSSVNFQWTPYIKGAKGTTWFEPLTNILLWKNNGLSVKTYADHIFTSFTGRIYNEKFYFKPGVAYSTIGSNFSARIRRYQSIFDISGASVFPKNPRNTTCLMNSRLAREVLSALNPTINFQSSDVKRLPLFPIESADEIFDRLDRAFTEHEAARETSVEFRQPAPSPWNYAQEWAQQAVDRPAGKPLPEYEPVYDDPLPTDYVSYAIGVALGRFGANGEGIIEPSSPNPFSLGEKGDNLSSDSSFLLPSPLRRGAGGEVLKTEVISKLAGRNRKIPEILLQRARELRKQQTPAEKILWECLRDRRLLNAKFRRQHNIEQIIADFYCHAARLIIEVDGGIHQQQQECDRIRDDWASDRGFRVLRFTNQEVFEHIERVLDTIAQMLDPSSPNPFSCGEKGDNASSDSPLLQGEGLGVRSRGAGGKVTLPNGILYLSAYSEQDSLEHSASQVIKEAWDKHGEKIAANKPLRKWLRESFFKDVHVKMYEKRPIYFPLSSEKKNFVAFVNIHRWTDNTLQTLLAEHLKPELTKLEGELKDLREAQASGNRGNQNRYATVQKLGEELQTFINLVAQCAERGAPQHKPQDTAREADARFQMNLDDGVMVNSAALWTLLEPQWKDPKKWWSELCNAKGKKDYDWSHLAARYFPQRVDAKCQKDPSLAVAHGCFWQYHPEKAYQWELRLQDEIAENFTIDEVNSDGLRQDFEQKYSDKIEELKTKEKQRRQRNQNRANSGED